jgi:nitroimidazol reductase NimA-like FMN-containing flavoprotein (pyridoxamine 5'-phosphate oxidase superfamily)
MNGGGGMKQRDLVAMSPGEISELLEHSRTLTLSSHNRDGSIHSVAMWYGFIDGDIAFSTRSKSQKAVNILRNDNVTCLIESGSLEYDRLKGVEVIGKAQIVTDADQRFQQARSSYQRNVAEYSDAARELVEAIVVDRLIVRVLPTRIASWDHSKLPPRGQVPESARRRIDATSDNHITTDAGGRA